MQKIECEKTIESGIPMPPDLWPRAKKYPFADMGVGDSFHLDTSVHRNRALSALWKWQESGKGAGWRFATRRVSDGYRLWRVE